MAIQRVRPMKMETTTEGGGSNDLDDTEMNPNQDYYDGAGCTFQEPTGTNATFDSTVYMDRLNGLMRHTDQVTGTVHLPAMSLQDDGGPACTCYYVCTGQLPITAEAWYQDAALTKLIKKIQYLQTGAGATAFTPNPIVTTYYAADGTTVMATYTDTLTYNGLFITNRNRVRS